MIHLYSFLASFVGVGLRGFQHKNVIGDHYKLVIVTAYIIAFTDVLMVGLIVAGGWVVCFAAGTGAARGMVTSMWVHRRFIK